MSTTKAPFDFDTGTLKHFLLRLFEKLDQQEIVYCILRNYEELPERIGNDIDMLILPRHVEVFEDCILKTAKDTGWNLLIRPKRFGRRTYGFHSNMSGELIHFDVHSLVTWKGLRWADEGTILDGRRSRKTFYIPDPSSEAVILFIKDLIQNGAIKKKYLQAIKEAAIEYPEAFAKYLRWSMGTELAEVLTRMAGAGEWEKIEGLKGRIRCAVFLRSFLRNPVEPILGVFRFLFGHLRSIAATPNGVFVALIGPDGSGKSTVAKGLTKSLEGLFPIARYYHGHFGIIPELRFFLNLARRLMGRNPLHPAPGGIHAIQDVPPHGIFRAFIYLAYYSVDYLLGYWIIGRVRSLGQLLILDRYFYDYFIQDQFRRLPHWCLRPLLAILPKPNMVVYLHNTAKVIHQRKPELSIQQIEGQDRQCQKIVKDLPYAVTVSTNPSVEQVVNKISDYIVKFMARRLRGSRL